MKRYQSTSKLTQDGAGVAICPEHNSGDGAFFDGGGGV